MSDFALPSAVLLLLTEHVESVTQLDLLLLVHRAGDRPWRAADIATQLRVTPAWASEQLALLTQRGFLVRTGDECRYAPASDLGGAVTELARIYQTHRVAVIAAIYRKPDRRLQDFADAFRLRKRSDPPDVRPPAAEGGEGAEHG